MWLRIFKLIKGSDGIMDLLRGGSINLFFQLLGMGLSYLFIFLISKLYGATGMGFFSISLACLNILVVIGKLGFDVSAVKFISHFESINNHQAIKEFYYRIIKIAIPVNLFFSILLFFLAPFICERILGNASLIPYLQIISFGILPMSLRFINSNGLRALKKISHYAFIQNVSIYLVALISIVSIRFLGFEGAYIPVISFLIALFTSGLISFFYYMKFSKFLKIKMSNQINFKEIFRVSTPLLLSSSILLVLGWADTLMLSYFTIEREVGIYNVALKIATASLLIFISINTVSAQKFAATFAQSDFKLLSKLYGNTIKLILIISIPIYIFLIIFSEFILEIFGSEFVSGSICLLFLLIGHFIKNFLGTSEYLLQMTDQQKILTIYALYALAVNIILNIILIPDWGIEGAAFASMISMMLYQVLLYFKAKRKIKSLISID